MIKTEVIKSYLPWYYSREYDSALVYFKALGNIKSNTTAFEWRFPENEKIT